MPADVHLYSDGRFADVPDFALANLQLHLPRQSASRRGTAGTRTTSASSGSTPSATRPDPTQLAGVRPRAELPQRAGQGAASTWTCFPAARRSRTSDTATCRLPHASTQPPIPDDPSPTNTGKDVPGESVAKFDLTGIDENADVTLHVKLTGVKDALAARRRGVAGARHRPQGAHPDRDAGQSAAGVLLRLRVNPAKSPTWPPSRRRS